MSEAVTLTKEDFTSDQEVRWCPGCGDYAILAAVQKVAPTLGVPRENFVFVSGIGCSSRFPYYMNTYGFHTIHGRAMTIASGLSCARPDLSVWVVTGDGDALSIGGNHFIHCLRRNMNLNVLLFNNKIYGLTKGQYSPTSELGKKTKSSPFGSIEQPVSAVQMALSCEATFVARSFDVNTPHLVDILKKAALHKGISFVEIYQNCNVFNDGAHKNITDKQVRSEHILQLEHGKPMIFGEKMNKGIRVHNLRPEIVTIGENGITEKDILVHDESADNPVVPFILSQLELPEFPVPMGIFRKIQRPTYEELMTQQIDTIKTQKGKGSLEKLIKGPETWNIK